MRKQTQRVPRVPTDAEAFDLTIERATKSGHSVNVLLETLAVLGYDVRSQQTDDRLAYGEQDAAELLSISPRTLYSLRKEGKVRAIKVGNRVIYSRDELVRFLKDSATE